MDVREQVMAGLVPWTRYAVTHHAKRVKLDEPMAKHYSEDGKQTICGHGMFGDYWALSDRGIRLCEACERIIECRIRGMEEVDLPITLEKETGLQVSRENNWLIGELHPGSGVLIRVRTAEEFRKAAAELLPMLPKEA